MKQATLITGICGSGKTHYARTLGFPSLSYDSIRNYQAKTTNYVKAKQWARLHHSAPRVTIDAWGFPDDPDLKILDLLLGGDRVVEVKYLYTTPLELHLSQLGKEARGEVKLHDHQSRLRPHAGQLAKEMKEFSAKTLIPLATDGVSVQWLFREGTKILVHDDESHLQGIIKRDPIDELLAWISNTSHDPGYQTIEIDGEIISPGYMKSNLLWDQIQQLGIDWGGKTVYDLGCFNGYFSFAVKRQGARKVVAHDCDEAVGRVFARLCLINKSQCEFVDADLSRGLPPGDGFDVALLLNSLHHIIANSDDAGRDFLDGVFIRANEVVAAVNEHQVAFVINAAAKAGHYLRSRRNTCNTTDQGPRQLLHFTTDRTWL